ncbi:MAG: transposase [bacterium]
MNDRSLQSRSRRPLDDMCALQFITFRLADSLPPDVVDHLKENGDPARDPAAFKRYLDALDEGCGSSVLSNPSAAAIIIETLKHFHGTRYLLHAYVVMPNHVHALIHLAPGEQLSKVLHSWKSFTSNEINKLLGRTGTLWGTGYFDRYIRTPKHYRQVVEYIHDNPGQARLVLNATDWVASSAGEWSEEACVEWYDVAPWNGLQLWARE